MHPGTDAPLLVEPYAVNLTRVEGWSFFTPFAVPPTDTSPGSGDPDDVFPANRATLGVRVTGGRLSLDGAFQYTQIGSLPLDGFVPGALGGGALYAFHAQSDIAFQLYLKRLTLTWQSAGKGLSLMVGRMAYRSGAEAASGVPAIEAVKRLRLDERLIGPFEWSLFERAFDGARVDVARGGWRVTGAALLPTQGGYEESATPTMERLRVGTVSITKVPTEPGGQPTEWQVFASIYRDARAVAARPDNTGTRASTIDVTTLTAGGSHVGIFPTVVGEFDTLAWGAVQGGTWYGQRHRAWSAALEAGHRWSGVRGRPWARAGVSQASGDGDGGDGRHSTFLPLLPSARRHALSTAYTSMNVRDVFAQLLLEPHARVGARLEVHRVDLASGQDRWYAGSGATQAKGSYFGFSGRPSFGETHLANVLEGSLDVRITRHWSVNGYLGLVNGGDVVRAQFAGSRMVFGYMESVVKMGSGLFSPPRAGK